MRRSEVSPLSHGAMTLAAAAVLLAAWIAPLEAQRGRGQAPASPQASAPIDLTGYWVAIVNEDWRWRMVTPKPGDYPGIPLSADGRRVADGWTMSLDGRCEAFGAPGVMRMPTRLHITWEDPATLRIDTDAGSQTRRLVFDSGRTPEGPRTLQGHSVGEWQRPGGGGRGAGRGGARGGGPPASEYSGTLRVTTTHLTEGWLRRNGVPYSEAAVLTEYFDRFPGPDGSEWLVVTAVVDDPRYLTRSFVTSSHFRREPDGNGWRPQPCRMP